MKKSLLFILLVSGLALICGSCGNDEPDPGTIGDDPAITRPKDGNGKAFDAKGILVDANIYFSASDLQTALSLTDWECEYIFLYDNTHVGDKFAYIYALIPQVLHKDGTSTSFNNYVSKMTVTGKEIVIHQPPLSSTLFLNNFYNVVALDYTEDLKRMIIDRKLVAGSALSPTPEGFKQTESSIRMVFAPVAE